MISATILQLLNAAPVLQALATQHHRGENLFAVSRMFLTLRDDISSACVSRDSLFNDENSVAIGSSRSIKEEMIKEFLANPLFAKELQYPNLKPLTPKILVDAVLSTAQLLDLGPFVDLDGR